MSINVTGIVVNNFENITKVTVEVLEMLGTIQRLKDKLIVTLPGRYNNIDYVDGFMYSDVHCPLTVQKSIPFQFDFSL